MPLHNEKFRPPTIAPKPDDVATLKARLEAWKNCATRLAHAYRDNSMAESTRAMVEYARLLVQEEGRR